MCGETEQDDRALIDRYRAGEEEALRILLRRNRLALHGWLRRRLPATLIRRVSVADLMQEVQLVAFRRCADFDPDGPATFRTWLIGIAEMKTREAVRYHQRAAKRDVRREVTRGQRADTARFPAAQTTPSQNAVAQEEADRAREALGLLREDDREILRLVRQEQLSLRDAAARMGRSYEAGRKLYARAIVRFKSAFDGLGSA